MERSERKLSDVTEEAPQERPRELRDPQSESHQMTLTQTIAVDGEKVRDFLNNTIEYHLTIRTLNESLSRTQLSLLLEVLNYQIVTFGCNLAMYLAMSDLYFRLLGNKRKSREIKESKIRKTLTVSEVLISSLGKSELPLSLEDFTLVNNKVKELLGPYILSKRTYGSRYRTWRPEKFFRVKIVPVDIQFLVKKKNTEPYSGYCKGYGESHPNAHQKKTKPSAELDGDGSNFVTSEEEFLFIRCTEPTHLLCESLLIKYRNDTGEEL